MSKKRNSMCEELEVRTFRELTDSSQVQYGWRVEAEGKGRMGHLREEPREKKKRGQEDSPRFKHLL